MASDNLEVSGGSDPWGSSVVLQLERRVGCLEESVSVLSELVRVLVKRVERVEGSVRSSNLQSMIRYYGPPLAQ